jgi:transposase
MSSNRYTDEFKVEAAKQVLEQGRSVRYVATRLGVSIACGFASSARRRRCGMRMRRNQRKCVGCRPSSSG